jgi:hypothetical protein
MKVKLNHTLKMPGDKGQPKYAPAGAVVEMSDADFKANPGVGEVVVAEPKKDK